jgi:hypothetical protein
MGLLCLFALGTFVTIIDCFSCLRNNTKAFLHEKLDNVVLDDWLRAIFDPEVGFIAVSTASFLGSSAMYSLAATDEQRVLLLQSGLWLRDKEMARKVLYEPGGIKLLLPSAVLSWLTVRPSSSPPAYDEHANEIAKMLFEEDYMGKVQDSSDDESATGLYEEEKQATRLQHQRQHQQPYFSRKTATRNKNMRPNSELRHAAMDDQAENPSNMLSNPPMPHEVLGSIVLENIRERLSTVWDQLPTMNRSTLGVTGGTAALLLLIQLRTSRRAREVLAICFQSLTTMGLSSAVVASLSLLISQRRDERQWLSYGVLKDHTLTHLRQNWKRYLAALFLLYLRQRHRRSLLRRN